MTSRGTISFNVEGQQKARRGQMGFKDFFRKMSVKKKNTREETDDAPSTTSNASDLANPANVSVMQPRKTGKSLQPVSGNSSISQQELSREEKTSSKMEPPSTEKMSITQESRFSDEAPLKDKEKKKSKIPHANNVRQVAEDVRDDKKVTLTMDDLHWHSGGVFSNVYRGRLTAPEKAEIAIKKTWPKESIRSDEMIILAGMRRAKPRNIIKLLYRFKNKAKDGTICEAFVFAYMPETLDKIIRSTGVDMVDTKIYTWQLFNGLDFLAANKICHRDIKPINILVNHAVGELQIGDFGSAKLISKGDRSSAYQANTNIFTVTRYYRPPEMLLGSQYYTHLIDVWSGGCVMGEMIKGRVLFRGSDSADQMELIQEAFGPPTDSDLHAMKLPSNYPRIRQFQKFGLLVALKMQDPEGPVPKLGQTTKEAIELLRKILVYKPDARACGLRVLQDPFFDDVLANTAVRYNRGPTATYLVRQSAETMGHKPFKDEDL